MLRILCVLLAVLLGCGTDEHEEEGTPMRISLAAVAIGGTDNVTYQWGPARTVNWLPEDTHPGTGRVLRSLPFRVPDAFTVTGATGVYAAVIGYTTAGAPQRIFVGNRKLYNLDTNTVYGGSSMGAPGQALPLPIAAGGPESGQVVVGDQYHGGVPWVGDIALQTQTSLAASLPLISTVTYFGQRFVAGVPNTGQFRWSALANGASWPAANIATAELNGDAIMAVVSTMEALALVGRRTVEWWGVTSDPNAPYQRIAGATNPYGTYAAATVAATHDAVYFVTPNAQVVECKPGSARVISTPAIELNFPQVSPAVTFAHILMFGTHPVYARVLDTTSSADVLCYATDSGQWFKWSQLTTASGTPTLPDMLGAVSYPEAGYTILGSLTTDKAHYLDFRVLDTALARRRITPNISFNGLNAIWDAVHLKFAGSTGGVAKKAYLSYSTDGGSTFSTRLEYSLPTDGTLFATPITFRALGMARERCWRIETDAADLHLVDAWADVRVLGR